MTGTIQRLAPMLLVLLLAACQSLQSPYPSPSPQVEPRSPGATDGSGGAVDGQRRPQPQPEAPADAREAINALQQQAEKHLYSGEWQAAIATAEHGLRLDRRHAAFYRLLAESYRGLGDREAAGRFARQAMRFCGDHCGAENALLRSLGSP